MVDLFETTLRNLLALQCFTTTTLQAFRTAHGPIGGVRDVKIDPRTGKIWFTTLNGFRGGAYFSVIPNYEYGEIRLTRIDVCCEFYNNPVEGGLRETVAVATGWVGQMPDHTFKGATATGSGFENLHPF